ncbi:MAG: hypothetical protein AAB336_11210, partial [Acidobacteriota bacterium]
MPNNFNRNQNLPNLQRQSESLMESFLLWEQRGRGWQIFDYEIELEPVFSRFSPPQKVGRTLDDARTQSLFGRLFTNKENKNLPTNNTELLAKTSQNIQLCPNPVVKLVSFRFYFPSELKISSEQTEQLLQTLASSASFIAFEIIGTNQEIIFQITCPAPEGETILAHLKGQLPTLDF